MYSQILKLPKQYNPKTILIAIGINTTNAFVI